MKMTEVLSPERVLSQTTANSKKKALEELSELLGAGNESLAASEVFSSLTAREKLGSTGLGRGVAIPHGRTAGIDHSVGAFLRLKQAINYESHDGKPVDLLFGLIVPVDATDEHLQHLATVAEMFSDAAFCQRLRDADEGAELFELFAGFEARR